MARCSSAAPKPRLVSTTHSSASATAKRSLTGSRPSRRFSAAEKKEVLMETIEVTDATLLEIVETIWTTVLGLPVVPRTDPQCVQNSRGLAVSVHIVGTWNGTV